MIRIVSWLFINIQELTKFANELLSILRVLTVSISDLSSVELKLKALDGKQRFVRDLLALLRRQAGEYNNVQAQKWIDNLNFK